MELEIKKYLFDIHESIASIESFLGDTREFKSYWLIKCFAGQLNVNWK